jgi:hypothetical protein
MDAWLRLLYSGFQAARLPSVAQQPTVSAGRLEYMYQQAVTYAMD